MQCHAHALCTVRFDGAQLAAPAGFQRCTLQGDSTHTNDAQCTRSPWQQHCALARQCGLTTGAAHLLAHPTWTRHCDGNLPNAHAELQPCMLPRKCTCQRFVMHSHNTLHGQTAAKPLVMPAVAVGTLETRRCKAKGPAAGAPPCQHHELTSDSCLMRKTTPHTNTAPHRPARQARFGDNRHSATLQHMARHAVRVPAQCLSKLHHADPRATLTAHRMTLHMASRLAPMC